MVLIATFALLALISIVAVVLSGEDTREYRDPRENPVLLTSLSRP